MRDLRIKAKELKVKELKVKKISSKLSKKVTKVEYKQIEAEVN